MRLLAQLDPGPAVVATVQGALVQSTIVVVLAAALARAAFRRRADARHALWLGVLVYVLLSPMFAAFVDRSGFAIWRVALLRVPVREAAAAPDVVVSGIAVPEDVDSGRVRARLDVRPRSGGDSRNVGAARAGMRGEAGTQGDGVAGALSLLWAAGVLVGLTRIVWGWRQLRALSRAARPLGIARHSATLERVRASLNARALPPIEISAAARGPVAVGLLRPRVVLPEGMVEAISEGALRDVLVHECAHVLRRDSWVGLLQRLAGALFWPHPWVHYLNGQLTRACEEVCDNHVLRCGDACSYARTLVALTALCRPTGLTRPGIGLLGARWTLADRVAGLLDPRRNSMTRASFLMRAVLGLALGVVVLSGASVGVGRQAPAQQPKATQVVPKTAAPASPNADFWNVDGVVVDEQGRPVAGALVRTMPVLGPADIEQRTDADGTFRFTLKSPSSTGLVGLVAEADGASRLGLDRSFDRRRAQRIEESARIVLKPSRTVTVRVKDEAGAPVAGATVEAGEIAFRAHATAGPDGSAILRIPADAQVEWVIAFQSRAGFDYFENYAKRSQTEFPPLPNEVVLTLEAPRGVRITAIDSNGEPVPGVVIFPARLYRTGRKDSVQARLFATLSALTDNQGIASFEWLPKAPGVTTFNVIPSGGYSSLDSLAYDPAGPADLTARVMRATRLSGVVRFADGRPARQVLIRANGWGQNGPARGNFTARTGDDGRFQIDVSPQCAYMVGVVDGTWVAQSLMNVAVHEGHARGGLDLTLVKGTLLHGRVTKGPNNQVASGETVMLTERGDRLPNEFRGLRGNRGMLMRGTTTTDALGRYRFRVGPGNYRIQYGQDSVDESLSVEVKDEPEVVRDVAQKVSLPETLFKGVVIEKTAMGERPVPKARIRVWPGGSGTMADDAGRVEIMRTAGQIVLFTYREDQSLAGFTFVSADSDNAKLVVSKAASVTGRVTDTSGEPRARHQAVIRLATGALDGSPWFYIFVTCDEQGRFTFGGVPAGSHGEISARHEKDAKGRPTRARTAMPFEAPDLEVVELPDLVVPTEKAGRP